jgi:hypothetical protein
MKSQWRILDKATTHKKERKVLDAWVCGIVHNMMVRYRQSLREAATIAALRDVYPDLAAAGELETLFIELVREVERKLVEEELERAEAAAAAGPQHRAAEPARVDRMSADAKAVRDSIRGELARKREHSLLPAGATSGTVPVHLRQMLAQNHLRHASV